MKCKYFSIRLQEDLSISDEATLNDFLKKIVVRQVYASLVNAPILFWSILVFYDKELHDEEHEEESEPLILTADEEIVYKNLKKWRNIKAGAEGIAAYMIAHNKQLQKMVKLRVRTKEDFLKIKGFGEKRTEKYGDDILGILNLSKYLD